MKYEHLKTSKQPTRFSSSKKKKKDIITRLNLMGNQCSGGGKTSRTEGRGHTTTDRGSIVLTDDRNTGGSQKEL